MNHEWKNKNKYCVKKIIIFVFLKFAKKMIWPLIWRVFLKYTHFLVSIFVHILDRSINHYYSLLSQLLRNQRRRALICLVLWPDPGNIWWSSFTLVQAVSALSSGREFHNWSSPVVPPRKFRLCVNVTFNFKILNVKYFCKL